jgi:hypothetical protein
MSLTTTLAITDMPENRASGNRRIRDWLRKVSRITYYNQSTEEVAQRGLRESRQGSNEDERENDDLSRALGTKEQ